MMSDVRSLVALVLMVLVLAGCASQSAQEPTAASAIQPVHSPERAAVSAEQGRLALESGQPGAAIEAFRKAVALDPSNAPAVNNLALLLQGEHRFTEAAAVLKQGLAASPDVAHLHYNLAVISELYLLDLELALAHYQRYRSLTPNDDSVVAGWVADLERRLQ